MTRNQILNQMYELSLEVEASKQILLKAQKSDDFILALKTERHLFSLRRELSDLTKSELKKQIMQEQFEMEQN